MDRLDTGIPRADDNNGISIPAVSRGWRGRVRERKGVVLALLLTAQFMAVIDVTIVNIAAPAIRSGLHTSGAILELIVSGYTVIYSTLLITGARLGDRYGHGRVFTLGLGCFTLMSLSCGAAPDALALLISRFAQGSAAALMMPQVMSIIQRTFDGPERARAVSLYGAVIAIGAVAGQVTGGLLVTANVAGLGWRPIFLVNVPIGLVLGVLVLAFLPRPGGDPARGFDLVGAVIIMAAVGCLVVPAVFGAELRWPTWCAALLAVVVPLGAACGWYERRRPEEDAIIPGTVARAPGFGWALAFLLLMQSSYAGALFAQAQHFQAGLGLTALRTGLLFISGGAGFAAGSLTWRRLPARSHRWLMAGGMLTAAAGYAVVAVALRDARQPGLVYGAANFVLSAAFGYGFGPALSRVPPRLAGSASGLLVSTLQVGQLLGVAVYGSVYFARHSPNVPASAAAVNSASALGQVLAWAAVACVAAAGAGWLFARSASRSGRA